MNNEAIISAEKLTFSYDNNQLDQSTVVQGVDLTIQKGSFVSIIGHNGSGKSTLAKLMNALLIPTDGTIVVTGIDTRVPESLWQIRQNVGMVFQNPDNQIVGTTVEDDVAFGLENMGVPTSEMRQRIDDALFAVKMQDFLQQQPHRLSGGQKQRVAIAGIMAMKPSVIILDESTAMLDPQGRKEVMSLANQLNKEEGITLINITHFPEETLRSDRVIVMAEGKVIADGMPSEVYEDVQGLQEKGVDVPFAMRIRYKLASRGGSVAPVLHQEELVDEICKLLLKT